MLDPVEFELVAQINVSEQSVASQIAHQLVEHRVVLGLTLLKVNHLHDLPLLPLLILNTAVEIVAGGHVFKRLPRFIWVAQNVVHRIDILLADMAPLDQRSEPALQVLYPLCELIILKHDAAQFFLGFSFIFLGKGLVLFVELESGLELRSLRLEPHVLLVHLVDLLDVPFALSFQL